MFWLRDPSYSRAVPSGWVGVEPIRPGVCAAGIPEARAYQHLGQKIHEFLSSGGAPQALARIVCLIGQYCGESLYRNLPYFVTSTAVYAGLLS